MDNEIVGAAGSALRCGAAGLLALAASLVARPAHAHEVARPGNRLCYYLSPVDGTPQPYHVYIPAAYDPTRPAPAAFFLHGFGGRTGPAGEGWTAAWADANGWLLVRPDGRGNQNWDGVGEDDLFRVLDDLQRATPDHPALNVDLQRLYVEGVSMGGHGAFRAATRHAGTFAAAAPVAGWTTHRDFYAHWYDAADGPRMGGYVDPARLPALETASALLQADHALWNWMAVTYDRNDGINPPFNAIDFIRRVRAAGGVRVEAFAGEAGHGGSHDMRRNFRFFADKRREAWPRSVRLTTNTLRYNRAHWAAVERLRVQNEWARLELDVAGQEIRARTYNLLAFALDLDAALLDMRRDIRVCVDDAPPLVLLPRPRVRLHAVLDAHHAVRAWTAGEEAPPPGPRKTPRLSGPIDDAFRSRFVVLYGARPHSRRAAAREDERDAQRFAAEWNAWMTLHWGNDTPPEERRDDWWQPPYPFAPGAFVHPHTRPLAPRPDTDYTLATLPTNANLVIFGDPASSWLIAQLAPHLPLGLSGGDGGPAVRAGPRTYRGEHVNYLFVAPNPLAPARYVVVARGYLSSRIDPARHGARQVGKDLEALPFYWPDYVIWDARREPGRTVQDPLRYLPDAFLEAGYFGEDWRLHADAPEPAVAVEGPPGDDGAFASPARVQLAAHAVPGGFGVAALEYRINGGPWTPYREPFAVRGTGAVTVNARAFGKTGQFVYGGGDGAVRGAPAADAVARDRSVVLKLAADGR